LKLETTKQNIPLISVMSENEAKSFFFSMTRRKQTIQLAAIWAQGIMLFVQVRA